MKEKLKEKLIPKLKTFIKKRWKLLLIVAGVLAAIAIILNALRYTPVGLQLYARVMPFQLVWLYTDYGDFTISNGKQSAEFINGRKVSGDLPVYRAFVDDIFNSATDYNYKYYLCPLRRQQNYEIRTDITGSWETGFLGGTQIYHYEICLYGEGGIKLDSDWIVTTETDKIVKHRISLYWAKCFGNKWLDVQICGDTIGVSGGVSSKGYHFSSSNPSLYEVEAWAFPEGYRFEGIEVDEEGILLKEKNSKEGIIMRGKEVIERFDISDSERVWFY